MLETWGCDLEAPLDKISFEKLLKDDAGSYLEHLYKLEEGRE